MQYTERALREYVEDAQTVDECLWELELLQGLDYISDSLKKELSTKLRIKAEENMMDFIVTRKSDGKEILIKNVLDARIVKAYNAMWIRFIWWGGFHDFSEDCFTFRPAEPIFVDGAGI